METDIKTLRKHILEVSSHFYLDSPLTQETIKMKIPHRTPFIFVDSIKAYSISESVILGTLSLPSFHPIFEGHFPGNPIVPGVIHVEAIGQCSLILQSLTNESPINKLCVTTINHASFIHPIYPDDSIEIRVKNISKKEDLLFKCIGQCIVNKKICSITEITGMEL